MKRYNALLEVDEDDVPLIVLWGLLDFQEQGSNEVDEDVFPFGVLWGLSGFKIHDI